MAHLPCYKEHVFWFLVRKDFHTSLVWIGRISMCASVPADRTTPPTLDPGALLISVGCEHPQATEPRSNLPSDLFSAAQRLQIGSANGWRANPLPLGGRSPNGGALACYLFLVCVVGGDTLCFQSTHETRPGVFCCFLPQGKTLTQCETLFSPHLSSFFFFPQSWLHTQCSSGKNKQIYIYLYTFRITSMSMYHSGPPMWKQAKTIRHPSWAQRASSSAVRLATGWTSYTSFHNSVLRKPYYE